MYKSKLDNVNPSELNIIGLVELLLFKSHGFYGVRKYREMKDRERKQAVLTSDNIIRENYTPFNREIALNHLKDSSKLNIAV